MLIICLDDQGPSKKKHKSTPLSNLNFNYRQLEENLMISILKRMTSCMFLFEYNIIYYCLKIDYGNVLAKKQKDNFKAKQLLFLKKTRTIKKIHFPLLLACILLIEVSATNSLLRAKLLKRALKVLLFSSLAIRSLKLLHKLQICSEHVKLNF